MLHKGDPDRGAILMLVASRGRHVAAFERVPDLGSNDYRWQRTGPAESAGSAEIQTFLAKRTQFDADLWAIELDIAEPERFIAETTSTG